MREIGFTMGGTTSCIRSERFGATESRAPVTMSKFWISKLYLREDSPICTCCCCLRCVWNETNHSERSNISLVHKAEQLWLLGLMTWGERERLSHLLLPALFQYPHLEKLDFRKMVWDPKRGFVIPSHSFTYSGVLACTANITGSVFSSYYLVHKLGEWLLCAKEWPQYFCFIANPLAIIYWLALGIFDISNCYVSVAHPNCSTYSKLILPLVFLFNRTCLIHSNCQVLRWYRTGAFYSNLTTALFAWIEQYLHQSKCQFRINKTLDFFLFLVIKHMRSWYKNLINIFIYLLFYPVSHGDLLCLFPCIYSWPSAQNLYPNLQLPIIKFWNAGD